MRLTQVAEPGEPLELVDCPWEQCEYMHWVWELVEPYFGRHDEPSFVECMDVSLRTRIYGWYTLAFAQAALAKAREADEAGEFHTYNHDRSRCFQYRVHQFRLVRIHLKKESEALSD
jgi:hypothetical protein